MDPISYSKRTTHECLYSVKSMCVRGLVQEVAKVALAVQADTEVQEVQEVLGDQVATRLYDVTLSPFYTRWCAA
jgi:hypothetical protein